MNDRTYAVAHLADLTRFRLPTWAHRALMLAAPGRPLAPTPGAAARGLSLSPANASGLLHREPIAWAAWSDAEAA